MLFLLILFQYGHKYNLTNYSYAPWFWIITDETDRINMKMESEREQNYLYREINRSAEISRHRILQQSLAKRSISRK